MRKREQAKYAVGQVVRGDFDNLMEIEVRKRCRVLYSSSGREWLWRYKSGNVWHDEDNLRPLNRREIGPRPRTRKAKG